MPNVVTRSSDIVGRSDQVSITGRVFKDRFFMISGVAPMRTEGKKQTNKINITKICTQPSVGPRSGVATNVLPEKTKLMTITGESRPAGQRASYKGQY